MTARSVSLTKHHGLGNDFLVCIDQAVAPDAGLAQAACDRHHGVGADGLMFATISSESGQVAMTLFNNDGSRAEMSGNGIRCFAQALDRAGLVDGDDVVIHTDAGERKVVFESRSPKHDVLAAEMGGVEIAGDASAWIGGPVEAAALASVGNPHLVLLAPSGADVEDYGQRANRELGGINVEVIRVPDPGSIDLTVYERGVGVTQACGTGACAAAAVAKKWGLVHDDVAVRMPGGGVRVRVGDNVVLSGPAVHIADIEFAWP